MMHTGRGVSRPPCTERSWGGTCQALSGREGVGPAKHSQVGSEAEAWRKDGQMSMEHDDENECR